MVESSMAGLPQPEGGVPTIEDVPFSAAQDWQDKATVVRYGAGEEKSVCCNAIACSMIHWAIFF